MTETHTPEPPTTPESDPIPNLLQDFKDTLRSSPEFTQKALQYAVGMGKYLEIPQKSVRPGLEGKAIVSADTLQDAAAEFIFSGRHPQGSVRFRLGIDPDIGKPVGETYTEVEVGFRSSENMEFKLRERNKNDTSIEGTEAPAWSGFNINMVDGRVTYTSGGEEEPLRTSDPKVALPKGRELLARLQSAIPFPRQK